MLCKLGVCKEAQSLPDPLYRRQPAPLYRRQPAQLHALRMHASARTELSGSLLELGIDDSVLCRSGMCVFRPVAVSREY